VPLIHEKTIVDNANNTLTDFMKRLLCSLTLPAAFCIGAFAADITRPNILFTIADDWGLHAGAYGTRWVKTPALDRIAREGLLFQNAYTPMAKCAPSRAIVLTGRHLWQNEEAGNHLAYFPLTLKSWPETLMTKGWHMGFTGKGWGPGVANDASGKPRLITGKSFNARKTEPPATAISNNDYAANFKDFLDDAPKDAPWCFWYGAHEPHRGYEFQVGVSKGGKKLTDIDRVPDYWPDNETVRHDMLDYAFEVEHVDTHLGRMIGELERRGLLDNTLVIVTSDHGMPFPRVKGYAYHDSNHVPLVIRWPRGVRSPGRSIEDLVDFTDIAPTLLDYAGIAWPDSGMMPITGKTWRPILESSKSGRVVPERDHVLIGKERADVGRPNNGGYPIRGIVTADHLYLRNYEPGRWPAGNPETGYLDTDGSPTKSLILDLGRANRADRYWQLNFGMRPAEELYELRTDRDCVHNLANDAAHAERITALRGRMESMLKAQGDPRMGGRGQVFDQYTPTNGDGFYEKFMRGEKLNAGWVNPTDFEKQPVIPKQ
jgi:N-sulfoglucosamine sulfohydrolase